MQEGRKITGFQKCYNTLRNLAYAIYRDFIDVNIDENFNGKCLTFFIFLIKTLIVSTQSAARRF